ncbi:hypothetical protein MNEG_15456 [Monoraphidium neglectum]|uniref:Uncharacterized protein n=1 Tax=Monoraphidium neglectum TaxID=145388 RepID=A0A0D2K8R5_9CHLO|nr:hypothetical protein MNEG_15456 [Monoraphidium neglectum]KIY92508.1 hypothetical protein MNEG_15456 [Monoraphidium neglectum]|eukprot:XP_013891528.1 hypothetical protein MNEG_15456 [Monoraphidium neglectum]
MTSQLGALDELVELVEQEHDTPTSGVLRALNTKPTMGFDDVLVAPWSTRDALRGVWAAALREPLTPDLGVLLRTYMPHLEALHYEGEPGRRGCDGVAAAAARRLAGMQNSRVARRRACPAHTAPAPTPADLALVLELVAACEQAPGSFRLRLLRLELAPEVAGLTLTIRGGGGCGGGGGAEGPGLAPQAAVGVGLRLSADRAWGDEAAARLRAALPAFRRLQVLLLRGATPRQEAALAQVRRRGGVLGRIHAAAGSRTWKLP